LLTQFSDHKLLKYTGLIVCVSCFGFWLWQSLSFVPHDFSNSYFGAYFFLNGEFDLQIFDPLTFNQKIYHEGFKNIFASYNPNPPFTALFFAPLALLPLTVSKFIFNLICCALFILSAHRLTKFLNVEAGMLFLLIPIIFFIPLRNEILFGQTYFLLFFFLTEGFLAIERGNKIIGAWLWAFAILLKVFPVIVFLFLLLKKDWKSITALSLICIVSLAAAISIQGFDVWHYYFIQVLPKNGKGEISSAYMINYQSAHMFFKHAFLQNNDLNPNPFVNSNFLFLTSQIIFKSFVLGICTMAVLNKDRLLSFGMLLLGAILLSPYGSTYSNILLIVLMLATYKCVERKNFWIVCLLLFLISNLPLALFTFLPRVLQFPRLLLYSALMLFIFFTTDRNFFQWKLVLMFVSLFYIPVLFMREPSKDQSRLIFKDENQSLIFDYGIKNHFIYYNYWNENGSNEHQTKLKTDNLSQTDVELRNNQIFFKGRQLTSTPDNKMKPMLLEHHSIIYLSDKDRGIGFYNLRMITL
jgi:hypothetical protein